VQEIAKDKVDLNCLISPDQDPHTFEARPSDKQAIEQADIVFYGGLNFEPAISDLVSSANTPAPKLPLNELATPNPLFVEEDGKKEPDPHVWHDAENTMRMVKIIQENLAKLDPTNAAEYSKNAAALETKFKALHAWVPKQIQTIPKDQRRLVTTHDAMGYYSRAYGIPVEGTLLGVSTDEAASAAKVKSLSQGIQASGVPVIFGEVTANDKVLRTVAKEAGVKISPEPLVADGLGAKDSPQGTFVGMMESNTCNIAENLGGQCVPFKP
jgi:ABC-type Zn uptake system ZnuABC Zn-binding protein ZnuA